MKHQTVSAAIAAAALVLSVRTPAAASPPMLAAGLPNAALALAAPAPAAQPLHLAIVLNYRHDTDLQALVDAEAVPGSPLAHHVLSAAQFAAYFAPAPDDYARTAGALARHGLRVTHVYPNRTLIDVVAPVRAIEQTFGTRIGALRRADGSVRYLNVRPAYVPADLRSAVYGVAGFDTGAHSAPLPRAAPAHFASPDIAPGGPLEGPQSGFGPEAYSGAYDFPDRHQIPGQPAGTTYDGAKQGIALVAVDDFLEDDLDRYLGYFKITRTGPATKRIPIDGGAQQNGIFSFITTLEAETIVGLSPGVVLNDYGVPEFDDPGMLDAYNQINSDDSSVVAMSQAYDCENSTQPPNFPQLADHLALQGTALGITYVADAGNYFLGVGCPQFAPSGDPHFVSVGGTVMLIDRRAQYKVELASEGSAGGHSTIFALPAYQNGVPGITSTKRAIPDIVFDGDPQSGGALLENRYWQGPDNPLTDETGDELSAAIFTSLVAEWAQIHGAPLGEIHGDLYRALLKYGYTLPRGAPIYHDITLGSDYDGFPAKPGYDRATGIGSIDGWNFASTVHF